MSNTLGDLTLNDAILKLMKRDYRLSIEYSELWCMVMIKLSKGEWHAMKGIPMEELEFIGERLLLDTINELVKDLEEARKESKRREQEDIGKIRKDCRRGDGMKVYNPNDFEYSKEKTSYIKFECMSCNKPVVLLARFSDGHRCRFCNGHVRPVSYVRRKEDIGKLRKDSEDIGKLECSLGG